MKMRSLAIPYLILSCLYIMVGCQRELHFNNTSANDSTVAFRIVFEHKAGNAPFLPNVAFTNALNENYTVTTLRYYVSGIELRGDEISADKNYYLIDAIKPGGAGILANARKGNYRSIRFLLGVDSVRNVSGAQTGALDPVNGMFWTWNTGYIMWKLEGNSPQSTEANQRIMYHIGGFASPLQTQKECIFLLPETLRVTANSNIEIRIGCDVNGFFDKVHALPIASNANCTVPGLLAVKYADNYQQIFQIISVQQ